MASPSESQRARRALGPRTRRGRERRAELLQAARSVFERKGWEGTRIADIAAAVPVAIGTFYTYFPDKESVFQEIAAEVVADMYDSMHLPDPSEDVYDTVFRTHRRFIAAYRRNAIIIAMIREQARVNPAMRVLHFQLRDRFVGPGARALRAFQEKGLADASIAPRLAIEAIAGMATEICYQWIVLGKYLGDEDTVTHLLTRLWLRAAGVKFTAPEHPDLSLSPSQTAPGTPSNEPHSRPQNRSG